MASWRPGKGFCFSNLQEIERERERNRGRGWENQREQGDWVTS